MSTLSLEYSGSCISEGIFFRHSDKDSLTGSQQNRQNRLILRFYNLQGIKVNQTISAAHFSNKKLRDTWLASLPLAHHEALERQLKTALDEINSSVIPPNQRFVCLETVSRPAAELVNSVKENPSNRTFPTQEKHYQRILNLQALLGKMIKGYFSTLESLSARGHDAQDSTLFSTTIFRAMQLSFTQQYLSYTNYRHPHISTWANINKLYYLAFSKRTNLARVKANPIDLVQAENIESLYTQILLLSLSHPLQLSNKMTVNLTNTLVYWARYCSLYDVVDLTNHHGIFAIRLNDNHPPKPVKEYDLTVGNSLFFDTSKLLGRFKQIIARPGIQLLPKNVQSLINNHPLACIKRIYKAWGKLGKRTFSRRRSQDRIVLTIGFNAIHNMLGQRQALSSPSSEIAEFQSKDTLSDNSRANSNSIEFYDYISAGTIAYTQPPSDIKSNAGKNTAAHRFDKLNALVLDESAGGFCLSLSHKTPHSICVGSLVCCQYDDQDKLFTLCVVRWMEETNDTFSFGIEVLSPFAETASLLDRATDEKSWIPILLLPQIVSLNRDATLVMARSTILEPNRQYLLITQKGEQTINLGTNNESTDTYSQFRYSTKNDMTINMSGL